MSDLIFRAMLHMLLDGKDYSIAELVQEAKEYVIQYLQR